MNQVAKSIPFRVCVYPSKDDDKIFVAHCLELDVIGVDNTVEGALCELLECIDTQLATCAETGAQLFVPAPADISAKYLEAKKAGRVICAELLERVIKNANRRLGHTTKSEFDDIVTTEEIKEVFA